MKNTSIILSALLALFIATACSSQKSAATAAAEKTATFKVLGNCGMCQKTIQTTALKAGASKASWDVETHVLTASYNSEKTNVEKMQEAIAKSGYDTPLFKTTEATYSKLHGCCQYDRKESLVQ